MDDLKVGDLITAWHAGIHQVTRIEKTYYRAVYEIPPTLRGIKQVGDEGSPLVYYAQRFTKDFRPVNGKRERYCGIAECALVTKAFIDDQEAEMQHRFEVIRKVLP